MRILLAYDGSPSADAAVDEVLRRPWPASTEVRLVTVVERPFSIPPADGIEVYAPLYERMRASLREDAYRRIQAVLEKFKARPDLQATYELRDGSVKGGLLDAIREWKAELVIAGSHGATGLARLVLGSVCHALVTHAPCNVEVVKIAPAP
jgi:nucleotide-binding universal stress UspA family protein